MNTPITDAAARYIDGFADQWVPRYVSEETERELYAVTAQRDELQQWKNDQMTVNSEWEMQTVGELLGVRLGESITSNIEPQIRKLIKHRDEARGQRDRLLANALHKFLTDRNFPEWLDENDIKTFRDSLQSLTPNQP